MSDTDTLRRSLGAFKEDSDKQGDRSAIKNALDDTFYAAMDSIYKLPYPERKATPIPAKPAPKPPTKPVLPTGSKVLASPAPTQPNSVASMLQGIQDNIAGGQKWAGETFNFDPNVENVIGAGAGVFNMLGGVIGGAAGKVAEGANVLDEAMQRNPRTGALPDGYKPFTEQVADVAGQYNERIQEPIAGIGAKLVYDEGKGLPLLPGKGWRPDQWIEDAAKGDWNSVLFGRPQAEVDTRKPANNAASALAATTALALLQKGDIGGALNNALDAFGKFGNEQYDRLDAGDQLAASLLFDPLNFIPGLGIGELNKASKLDDVLKDVGKIDDVAKLLPESRLKTPMAKITETVKSALNELFQRTAEVDNADELFNTVRAFEKAGEAGHFDEIAKVYAGVKTLGGNRLRTLLQGMGKELDEVEAGYRTAQTVLQGATVDAKTLPKTYARFLDDIKANPAAFPDPQAALLDMTKGDLYARSQAHMAKQATKVFPQKGMNAPTNIAKRFMNNMKAAEALVYIGLSPFTFLRNFVNGITTMAIEGVNPIWDAASEVRRLQKLGKPEMAASLQRAMKMQQTMAKTGDVVRGAFGQGQFATSQTGAMGSFMSKMIKGTPVGKPLQWYQRMEEAMRAQVWTQTYWKGINSTWRVGKGFKPVDAVTEAALNQYGRSASEVHNIIEAVGPNEGALVKAFRDWVDGKFGAAIDWNEINKIMAGMGVPEKDIRQLLDQADVEKFNAMAREISERVLRGENQADVVEEVVAKAATETAQGTATKTGATQVVDTAVDDLEAQRGALVQQWNDLTKGGTRNGKQGQTLLDQIEELEAQIEAQAQNPNARTWDEMGDSDAFTKTPPSLQQPESVNASVTFTSMANDQVEVLRNNIEAIKSNIRQTENFIAQGAYQGDDLITAQENIAKARATLAKQEKALAKLEGNNPPDIPAAPAPEPSSPPPSSPPGGAGTASPVVSGVNLDEIVKNGTAVTYNQVNVGDRIIFKHTTGTRRGIVQSKDPGFATFSVLTDEGDTLSITPVFNRTVLDNVPLTQPKPPLESDLPPVDFPEQVLSQGQQNARDYLLGIKKADGTPLYTEKQLATWKPETLETVAGERQMLRATFDDIMLAAKNKGVPTASETGAPVNKRLINALNDAGGYALHDAKGKVTGYKAGAFKTIDDVRARSDEAVEILNNYTPSVKEPKAAPVRKNVPAEPKPTSPAVGGTNRVADVGAVKLTEESAAEKMRGLGFKVERVPNNGNPYYDVILQREGKQPQSFTIAEMANGEVRITSGEGNRSLRRILDQILHDEPLDESQKIWFEGYEPVARTSPAVGAVDSGNAVTASPSAVGANPLERLPEGIPADSVAARRAQRLAIPRDLVDSAQRTANNLEKPVEIILTKDFRFGGTEAASTGYHIRTDFSRDVGRPYEVVATFNPYTEPTWEAWTKPYRPDVLEGKGVQAPPPSAPAAQGARSGAKGTKENPKPFTVEEIKVGDEIGTTGGVAPYDGRRHSPISGKVKKANPKTLVIETEYMGKPMELKIRRDELGGEVRAMRDGEIYSTEAGKAGNVGNASDSQLRGFDPNEQHTSAPPRQHMNAADAIENLRSTTVEDEAAASILSRDEMVKSKARTQADVLEALHNLWQREDVRRVRVGTDASNRVFGYLRRDVIPAASETRQAATVAADWMDNAVMISRDGETKFDAALGVLSPFQFWRSRFALQSLRRIADKPARLAWYLKLREGQDQIQNDPRYPKRLQGMMRIPNPFAPAWAGDMFADMLEFGTSIEQTFGANQFQDEVTDQDVARSIRALASRGQISLDEAANVIANQSGALWEQTKLQLEEHAKTREGADSFSSMFRPHLPFDIAWKIATGSPEEIGVLFPMTRLIRGATGVNIEQPIKAGLRSLTGAKDIPDWDMWDDQRTDKAIADMVGDGLLSPRDALIAMIERKGPAFDQAQARAMERAKLQSFSGIGGQFFPTGEKEYYKAKVLRDQMINQAVAQLGGNPDDYSYGEKWDLIKANGLNKKGTPLGDFYKNNPAYDIRGSVYDEPEYRLKNMLSDEIWKVYNEKGALDKRLMNDDLGDEFKAKFLDKDTRNLEDVTLDQLAEWVVKVRGYVPQQQMLQPGEFPEVRYGTLDQNERYSNIQNTKNQLFDMDALQPYLETYSGMTGDAKYAYRDSIPMLDAYLDWYGKQMKENPDIGALINPDYQASTGSYVNARDAANDVTRYTVANLENMIRRIGGRQGRGGGGGASPFAPVTPTGKPPVLSNKAKQAIAQKRKNPQYFIPRDVYEELLRYFRASGIRGGFQQWLDSMVMGGVM